MKIAEGGRREPGTRELVGVFGGTGFLGRRIVEQLLSRGCQVRAISRHPERARQMFGSSNAALEPCHADILDEDTIPAALKGADGVVNAVSLYVEQGAATFDAVHAEGAGRLAGLCDRHGVRRFIQISGIGANKESGSRYIRARGQGEAAVREAFPEAIVMRPAVMFGPDDRFLTTLVHLVKRLPVFPLFGRGKTKLQPVFVEDVAGAVVRLLIDNNAVARTYEMAGPHIYTYRSLVEEIAAALGVQRLLVPLPFGAWKLLAAAVERSPWQGLTVNQVELMEIDTATRPDLKRLGIEPTSIQDCLQTIIATR